MAPRKVTLILDSVAVARLRDAAARLVMPTSIIEFHERLDRLSERERLRMLRTLDEVVPRIPNSGLRAVKGELRRVRRARRRGGRKSLERRHA